MLTCKQFLQELNDFLDDTLDPKLKAELQKHVNECPNCWVVCDTTEKTLKGLQGHGVPKQCPADIQARLMAAIESKMRRKRLWRLAVKRHSKEAHSKTEPRIKT